jgi:creatinine amidohydrolase/Fe(II)-dependent formamide hydrolase-like protein
MPRRRLTGPSEAADITSTSHDDVHAGELETSILLAARPGYVRDGGRRPTTALNGDASQLTTDRTLTRLLPPPAAPRTCANARAIARVPK